MSPNASHRVRPGLSSAASLMTTLLISFDQEVLNQHLNLVTPEYPFFESPCAGPQGHSKKALGGEEDGIETVLGQGLANGRERSRQRPRQAQDRVAQRC